MASNRPWWRKKSEGHNCPRRQAPRKQSIHEKIQNWLQQQWVRLENDHGFQQEKDKSKEESSALKKKVALKKEIALNFHTSTSDLRKGAQLGWSQAGGPLRQQPWRDAVGTVPCLRAGAGFRTLASCCSKGFVYSTASSDLISDKGGVSLGWPPSYCKILWNGNMQHWQKSRVSAVVFPLRVNELVWDIEFLFFSLFLSELFNSVEYLLDFWTVCSLPWGLHRLSITVWSKFLQKKVMEFLMCYPIWREKHYRIVTSEASWRLLGNKGHLVHRFKQKLPDTYRGGPNELLG